MGEIDPQKFNHEMQVLKINVKVAIEHVIQKLVRDIKKAKNSLEKKPDDKKISRKVDNKVEVMKHLKSLKPLEFMKDLILWKPEEHTHPEKLTVSDKALFKVHNHRNMTKDIRKLSEKFELEKNPGRLFRYGTKKENLLKNPKKLKKNKKKLETDQTNCEDDMEIPNNSKLKANKKRVVKTTSSSEDEAFLKMGKETSSSEDEDIEGAPNKNVQLKMTKTIESDMSSEEDMPELRVSASDECSFPDPEKVQKKTLKKIERNINKQEKAILNKTKDVGQVDSLFKPSDTSVVLELEVGKSTKVEKNKLKKVVENATKKRKRPIEEPKPEGVQVVDSFFKTKEGTNYVAIAPKRSAVEMERQNKEFDELKYKKKKINDVKDFRKDLSKQEGEKPHLPWKASKQPNDLHEFKDIKMKLRTEIAEDLHPSWLAKQKEKGIKAFQGKKITFDDESKTNEVHMKTSKKEERVEDTLHPSWAAKQKQKGIKDFQGKKIKFDDDENMQIKSKLIQKIERVADESLHPSWLAKQKQKGIQQFKGTKISFEDN